MKSRLFIAISMVLLSFPVLAGDPNSVIVVPQSIPAVSQAGLIALAFIIGILGAHLIRKSKNTNS